MTKSAKSPDLTGLPMLPWAIPITKSTVSETEFKQALFTALQQVLLKPDDRFEGLSQLRDFVNHYFPSFEFYQEDLWNERAEGETHLDSILRCKRTLHETDPFAYDIYGNHRDSFGVWHLDDYRETVLLMPDTMPLVDFLWQFLTE